MSELEIIKKAMSDHFKDLIATSSGVPFEETKVSVPHESVWDGYAKAIVNALHSKAAK